MKVNFNTEYYKHTPTSKIYNKKIPGEFIDVSISKNKKGIDIEKDIVEYNKKDKNGNVILNFNSYTLDYFIKDLCS